tara:strand:+ start:198 stop:827 length:630 start_codon:yes stop_codon:yes gene_type:complete
MKMNDNLTKSYLISFTAGGLLLDETISLLPYLNDEKINTISEQIKTNTLLQTNSQAARQRIIQEVKKRYIAIGGDSFSFIKDISQNEQKIFLFYTCLKTYSILFDFLFDVVIDKWLSRDIDIDKSAVLYFLDKQSSSHPEIDDWTDTTIQKVSSVMIRMMNEVNLLKTGRLYPLEAPNVFWNYFVEKGDSWFLQACLLHKERRNQIIHG